MHRKLTFPAFVFAAALILACGGGDDDRDTTGVVTAPGNLTTATATADGIDKPTPAPTPAPGEVSVANEAFSVETPDGIVLKGHLYSPDGPKRQALIIVAPVEQSTWAESTQAFTSEGIAVFTFDMRGYGETGGVEDVGTLIADAQLVTRFVMSREYPLVYLVGIGLEGGAAVTETAGSLDEVSGVVTYGSPAASGAANGLALGGDATWNGEDVLAIPALQEKVLYFVLGI
jgi:hypothetical protein